MANTWWTADKNKAANRLIEAFQQIDAEQRYRRDANIRHLRLYGNPVLMGLTGINYGISLPSARPKFNVVQSIVDTALAILGSNSPKIRFLTDGGNYEQQTRAKLLTQFVSGQFYKLGHYAKARQVFLDALVFGSGFIKYGIDGDEIYCERVFPDELLVEDIDGRYGVPKTMYHHKIFDKETLMSIYPKYAGEIQAAPCLNDSTLASTGYNWANPVSMVESWHLPVGKAKGRRVVAVGNATLVDEEYKSKCFPIVKFSYNHRPIGYFGQGIPEMLVGVQIEINLLLQKIQKHMNLGSTKVFVSNGAHVNSADLNNAEFAVIRYDGDKPPTPVVVPPIAAEYFTHLDRLYQRAYEITGVSQMVSQAAKPEGLNSGKAIREFNDVQSRRFLGVGQAWEQFHIDCASRLIDLTKDQAESTPEFRVILDSGNSIKMVNWKDIDMDRDVYVMKGWPVNALPDTPAGKIQTLQELIEAVPQIQPYALELLDYPDLQAAMAKLNAPLTTMNKIINSILDDNKYTEPEEYMDLLGGVKHMQYAYLEAKTGNAPESKLALMRQWIDDAIGIVVKQNEQAQQQAMAQQAAAPMEAATALELPAANPNVPV
jgi:hypothetical protein